MMQPANFGLRDERSLRIYLEHSVADPQARQEFQAYLDDTFHRFIITMEFLPERPGRVLEIGATPYFLTLLMKRFRPYDLELSNFFGQTTADSSIIHEAAIDNPAYGEHHQLLYRQFNVECQVFPYDDDAFDGVLFCEVLEHLSIDPMAALAEIHRVLKPGGWLVVTTPNAAWYYNIARLWLCHNIHSSYSAHGVYGRHNREYTLPELEQLLGLMGFQVECTEARDLHPGRKFDLRSRIFRALKPARLHEEGLFCRAVKSRPMNFTRPDWLYSLGYKMPLPSHLRERLERPVQE